MSVKTVWVIEWYESYQDENCSGDLQWFDNLDRKHSEVFDSEEKFMTRLRKLQSLNMTKDDFGCKKGITVGTISQYSGEICSTRY